ncbi:MAG: CHAD domain-containing protein [Burkholderiales bacterium]
MTVGQAYRRILANCLGHLRGNRGAVANSDDIEAVHQMRVAGRRLRAALALFEPPDGGMAAELAEEVRWLALCLGNARDWDVFVTETWPLLMPAGAAEPEPLFRLALGRQAAARLAARKAVRSRRYRVLINRLEAWIADEGTLGEPSETVPRFSRLGDHSGKLLAKRQRRVLRRAGKPDKLTEKRRHALRISAKKLRYTAEFLSSLYPATSVRPYLKQLSALQEDLGVLNDGAVTRRLLDELAGEAAMADSAALTQMGAANARRTKMQLRSLKKNWRRFELTTPFWESKKD